MDSVGNMFDVNFEPSSLSSRIFIINSKRIFDIPLSEDEEKLCSVISSIVLLLNSKSLGDVHE